MESITRCNKGARLNMLMALVLFLGKVQRDRTVSFAVDKLLHFGVWTVLNFIWCAFCHNRAMAEHDHPRGDAKGASHIV